MTKPVRVISTVALTGPRPVSRPALDIGWDKIFILDRKHYNMVDRRKNTPVNTVKTVNTLGETFGTTHIDMLYDHITDQCLFLLWDDKGNTNLVPEYERNGIIYRPLVDNHIRSNVVQLPSKFTPITDNSSLLFDIKSLLHKYVEITPDEEEIASRYVLMSWVYEVFEKIPYLRIMGHYGTGKSRFLKLMFNLCFRSSNLGAGITEATIFRWPNKYPGTLIVDEANFKVITPSSPLGQILNIGYDRDGKVIRSFKGKDDYEPRSYNAFGPKAFAAQQPFQEISLESRFLTILSKPKTREDIPDSLPSNDAWTEMIAMRERLLIFRVASFHNILITKVNGLEGYDPRTAEIIRPLCLVTNETEIPKPLISFLDRMKEDQFAQFALSDLGVVIEVLMKYDPKEVRRVMLKDIVGDVNRLRGNTKKLSNQEIGYLVKELGFKSEHTNNGNYIVLDHVQLSYLAKRHGFIE